MEVRYEPIRSEQTHPLRQKVLRPHQALEEMIYPLDKEKGSHHVGAFWKNNLIGIASIYPESQDGQLYEGQWRLRGMAVEADFRGNGVGRSLIGECLQYAKEQKAANVWCNARTSAIGFYIAFGFAQVGEEFEIPGIGPHYIAKYNFTP